MNAFTSSVQKFITTFLLGAVMCFGIYFLATPKLASAQTLSDAQILGQIQELLAIVLALQEQLAQMRGEVADLPMPVEEDPDSDLRFSLLDTDVESDGETGTFRLEFELTAVGTDVYIPKQISNDLENDDESFYFHFLDGNAPVVGGWQWAATIDSSADLENHQFVIDEGDTETFELRIDGSTDDFGSYAVAVAAIKYFTDGAKQDELKTLGLGNTHRTNYVALYGNAEDSDVDVSIAAGASEYVAGSLVTFNYSVKNAPDNAVIGIDLLNRADGGTHSLVSPVFGLDGTTRTLDLSERQEDFLFPTNGIVTWRSGVYEGYLPIEGPLVIKVYVDGNVVASDSSEMKIVKQYTQKPSIFVTAPNGGEEWVIGKTNTITWRPYDYNPDVNPAKDVDVYLEKKKSDGSFRTVGKVMDLGKASLHTRFEIDEYGKYPKPGKYYVRAVNRVTGEWDRSDKPFKLLAEYPINVTAPNGGEVWTIGKTNTITWSPYGYNPNINPAGDVDVYLQKKRSDGTFKTIGKVKDLGKASLHTRFEIDQFGNYAKPGKYYILAKNRVTGARDRSDRPFTLVADDTVAYAGTGSVLGASISEDFPEASITVMAPNGGEVLTAGEPVEITWDAKGTGEMSLALYKDNKWLHWISRDMTVEEARTGSYVWTPTEEVFSKVGTTDPVLKIYATAIKSDMSGYTDDKSDETFSMVSDLESALIDLAYTIGDLVLLLEE